MATLTEVMTHRKASASARVSAAKAVIDLSLRVAYEDLEVRVSTLEKVVKQKKGQP